MKKHILFITKFYKPHIGGVEKHVENVSKQLIDQGYKVSILAKKHDEQLKDREVIDGMTVTRFSYPKIKFIGLVAIWYYFIKNISLFKNVDIIHIHDVFIWYLPLRILLYKKKILTTFHGWEGKFPVPLKNILYKRLAAKLSKKNICVGKYIEKYYGVKASEVIYGAVEVSRTQDKIKGSTQVQEKNSTKFIKNKKSIVYVGRLEKDTGLLTFLQTLNKLKNYTVHFCGDGPLAAKCRRYGKVHGFCDPKPYLQTSQFCFAGGYLSALEGFASKCIVVTTFDNQLKKDYWQLAPFAKWIVCKSSSAILANEIMKLQKNNKQANTLIKHAHKWVKKQSWEQVSKKYINLYGIM